MTEPIESVLDWSCICLWIAFTFSRLSRVICGDYIQNLQNKEKDKNQGVKERSKVKHFMSVSSQGLQKHP